MLLHGMCILSNGHFCKRNIPTNTNTSRLMRLIRFFTRECDPLFILVFFFFNPSRLKSHIIHRAISYFLFFQHTSFAVKSFVLHRAVLKVRKCFHLVTFPYLHEQDLQTNKRWDFCQNERKKRRARVSPHHLYEVLKS